MGDEHEAAVELGQAVLENLQRWDVEIVRRLVEDQHVDGLAHQARDQDPGLLAARQAADGHLELLGSEEKALGPRGDVDAAALEGHGIALGRQRAAQRLLGIEAQALLLEAHEAEAVGPLDEPRVRREGARQQVQQRRLAAAVRTHEADPRAGRDGQIEAADERAAAEGLRQPARDKEPAGPALRGREVDAHGAGGGARSRVAELGDEAAGLLDAALGLGGARLGAPPQPLDLAPDNSGERFLVGGLAAQEIVPAGEEVAVPPV